MTVPGFKVLIVLMYFYDSLFDVLSYPLLFQSGTRSRRTLSALYPVPRVKEINFDSFEEGQGFLPFKHSQKTNRLILARYLFCTVQTLPCSHL